MTTGNARWSRLSALALCAGLALAACKKREPVVAPSSPVLVRVADRSITQDDVEQTLSRMLGSAAPLADSGASDKALDSLIALHAFAAKQEKVMPADELRDLDRRVFHYREELLMQAYLREHSQDLAVSENEVREFYEKHPELFGGSEVRRFETLATARASDADAAKSLQEVSPGSSWDKSAAGSRGKLVHAQATTDAPGLNPRVSSAVAALQDGQASDVIVVDGALLRVKLVGREHLPARPLPEVRDNVRRMVAARKTRDRIRELSESVKAETKVERVEEGT